MRRSGGDTARTADSNWPKGCSIPYHVMLGIQTGRGEPGPGTTAWGMAGYQSAGGKQLYCASLLFFPPFPLDFVALSFSLLFIITVSSIIIGFLLFKLLF